MQVVGGKGAFGQIQNKQVKEGLLALNLSPMIRFNTRSITSGLPVSVTKTRQHKINIDSTNSRENIKCKGSLNSKLTIFRMAYMHSTLEHVCKNLNVTTLPARFSHKGKTQSRYVM